MKKYILFSIMTVSFGLSAMLQDIVKDIGNYSWERPQTAEEKQAAEDRSKIAEIGLNMYRVQRNTKPASEACEQTKLVMNKDRTLSKDEVKAEIERLSASSICQEQRMSSFCQSIVLVIPTCFQ